MLAVLLHGHYAVFKAFVLSSVLALSLGPNVVQLCLAWCQPLVAEADCHDAPVSAPVMLSQADCCEPGVTAPVVPTNGLRDHAAPDGAASIVSPIVTFRLGTNARHGRGTDVSPPRPGRSLATVLRI